MTIKSRPFIEGDAKQGEWPSSNSKKGGVFYYNSETGQMEEGYPPQKNVRYGNAPMIITDTISAMQHPSNSQWIDSRSKFNQILKAHGHEVRTGMDRVASGKPKLKDVSEDDYIRDTKIATEQVQAGTAPLNEYDREVCKRINEQLRNKV